MGDPEAVFMGGIFVGLVIALIVMPLYVFKPRFEQLTEQRDHWKQRAELAENEIGRAEILDVHSIGDWDQPLPPDWLD